MSPRGAMIRCMLKRAEAVVPMGQPIIPEGPIATRQDVQEFKRLSTFNSNWQTMPVSFPTPERRFSILSGARLAY